MLKVLVLLQMQRSPSTTTCAKPAAANAAR